jgi:hypothetical protein
MNSSRRFAKVSTVFTGTLMLAAGFVLFNAFPADSLSAQAKGDMLQSSMARLNTAPTTQERLQAAKWLGQQEASLSSELVQTMGQSLRTDTDPTVRAAVAASFGQLAAKQNASSAGAGPKEPQMLEILSAAYEAESNPSVRARIMTAAGEFKDPSAVSLLNRGLVDSDPGVREAAQMSKQARYKKFLVAISG